MSFCHKLKFCNLYIFGLDILNLDYFFQKMHSLKYQMFTTPGFKDVGVRNQGWLQKLTCFKNILGYYQVHSLY